MPTISEEQRRDITVKLQEASATRPCPRCGEERFELLDGYIVEFTQNQLRNMVVGSHNRWATVAMVCRRCGFLAQHALMSLGLAPEVDAGDDCARKSQQIFS